ncbi:MAG: hypothetical protein H0X02_01880 [Nitrosomonas sp.]|nr:hypothetical protein [Nitrosomonas sp.]
MNRKLFKGSQVYLAPQTRRALYRLVLDSSLPDKTKQYLCNKMSGEYVDDELRTKWSSITMKRKQKKLLFDNHWSDDEI